MKQINANPGNPTKYGMADHAGSAIDPLPQHASHERATRTDKMNIWQLAKWYRRSIRRARNARRRADDMLPGTPWWKAMHALAQACDRVRYNVEATIAARINNPNSRAAVKASADQAAAEAKARSDQATMELAIAALT